MARNETGAEAVAASSAGEGNVLDRTPSNITSQTRKQAPAAAAGSPRFDYGSIEPDLAIDLKSRADRIRARIRKTTENMIAIGRELAETKEKLEHGLFVRWVELELGLAARTAQSFMAAAKLYEKSAVVALLPSTTVQRLAAKSAPPAIVEQVVAKAAAGEIVPDAKVKELIDEERKDRRCAELEALRQQRRVRKPTKKELEAEQFRQKQKEKRERHEQERTDEAVTKLVERFGIEAVAAIFEALVGGCFDPDRFRKALLAATAPTAQTDPEIDFGAVTDSEIAVAHPARSESPTPDAWIDLDIPPFLCRSPVRQEAELATDAENGKQPIGLRTPVYDVRSRPYCGPTAMSAVTGRPVSEIGDAIRQASGKITKANGADWPIMGVDNDSLIKAMAFLGWNVVEMGAEPTKYTLDEFAHDHGRRGPFIVNVTGHYVAISDGEFCDTFTKLPCDLFGGVLDRKWYGNRKRKGSTWVRRWWRFAPSSNDGSKPQ
jgi:Protein of unknown function (DUF3102)